MGDRGRGNAKWVFVAAALVVGAMGVWLTVEYVQDSKAAATAEQRRQRENDAVTLRNRDRQRQALGSGLPLASAHKPPPGWKPPKRRIPSKELFESTTVTTGGPLPTALPGRKFGIELPASWSSRIAGELLLIRAPEDHFTIIASSGTHADDGNTAAAIDRIGAVNCNWRRGDGPKHGKLGPQRVPAFFNEGVCGHTDGYGMIWIVRLFAAEHVTSLVARYSPQAGEDAEDVLLDVLRSVAPMR